MEKETNLFDNYINLILEKKQHRDENRLLLNNSNTIPEKFINNSVNLEEYYQLLPYIKSIEAIKTYDPLIYIIEYGKYFLEQGIKTFLLFDLDATLLDNSTKSL
ncbi:MAG: hypothetical protein KatS3mg068_0191 [Candidatus Sericytochromatia bacterium]|nr:MAG: hypothetical protein KatS3mg068_0191 [Candidatus Sericytochromatia bacterium]